ncbi:MAG: response regulator [Elusimicrobiales bacterium]
MHKALIIDDEPAIQQLFRYVLEEAEFEVQVACNGLEGLSALASGPVDIILLDVSMPEMDGRQFVAELMRRSARDQRLAEIPFVVMTGENFMESGLNRTFSAAPGFVCFLPKMTPPELVLEKVKEAMCRPPSAGCDR